MATLFLGVRIPNKAYEHLRLENINLESSVDYLKDEVSKKIDCPKQEIQLVYCGSVLDNNDNNLNELKVTPNTIIHVFKKTTKPQINTSNTTYTDEECRKIAKTFGGVTGTQISVQARMNILTKIITEYPEFRVNLGAQALIRDSVLFHSLDKFEVIKKVAQNYSVICDAADFIVKTTLKELAKKHLDTFNEEQFSSSSSEEDNSSSNNQSEQARIRRISRDQLAQALMSIPVGTRSNYSLSNIAQRNTNLASQENQQSPSASSATTSTPGRITSSIFNSALTQALMSTASATQQQQQPSPNQDDVMDILESAQPSNSDRIQYANQLQLMREMGLLNENINLQALILSNGEVETAVTLVIGGIHNLFN